MAKTSKLKNKSKSVRSRAARRETSPSMDADKSLKSLPRPEQSNVVTSTFLSNRINAGISKKRSASKAKSRAQRLRQRKGMERAETVLDQLEIKRTKSLGRAKTMNARRAAWEELNNRSSDTSKYSHMRTPDLDEMDAQDDHVMLSTAPEITATVEDIATVKSKPATIGSEPIDEDDQIT